MIYLNVLLNVKSPDDIAKVRGLLLRQAEASRSEAGCQRFEVYQSHNDPSLFMLIERWDTQQHVDRHRQGHAFREIYEPLVLPLVNRAPHPSDLVS